MRPRPSLVLAAALAGCGPDLGERTEGEPDLLDVDTSARGLIDCAERQDTGYSNGNAFPITVVTVDGRPAEVDTANAYWVMQQAAAADGVMITIVSGFRTMDQQEYLYGCYVNCNCNNCNLAARPGYSNHQSGHALDLNTSSPGVLAWLEANGARFGFMRTVPSEPWHWEWWGGGPGGGPCGGCEPRCEGSVIVAADCGRGDCADFAAHCSTVFGAPQCVSAFCVSAADEVPVAHDTCLFDGQRYRCDDRGGISPDPCPAGSACMFDGRCVEPAIGAVDPAPPASREGEVVVPARATIAPNIEGGCACKGTGGDASWVVLLALVWIRWRSPRA